MALVCVGDVVWQMKGWYCELCDGVLGMEFPRSLLVWRMIRAIQECDYGSRHVRECVGLKRYVDDVLICSFVLGNSCLFRFLIVVYNQQKLISVIWTCLPMKFMSKSVKKSGCLLISELKTVTHVSERHSLLDLEVSQYHHPVNYVEFWLIALKLWSVDRLLVFIRVFEDV